MNYIKINNITGWVVFLIATTVYILTLEPTGSFWDCGEFISTSYKLMVPHPPGAPLFLLLGRLFSFFALGDTTRVAYWINMCSALSSSFTILFLFWTITMLAKKMISVEADGKYSLPKIIAIMGSGFVGSLAFAFSDSFWFSSEEAEVYAMSSFFTAIVFWAMLKWESKVGEPGADRWLILLAYLVGLSIGVHLLNLVALPAIAFIYYFKKYDPKPLGIIVTFLVSALLIMLTMNGVITGLPSMASSFEVFAVNSLGLPFGAGIILFIALIVGFVVVGVMASAGKVLNEQYYKIAAIIFVVIAFLSIIFEINESSLIGDVGSGFWLKIIIKLLLTAGIGIFAFVKLIKAKTLSTIFLSITFILIGYSSYTVIVVRSQFQPTIDMNDPENIMTFVSYLKREQYGDRPLLKGPVYTASKAEYGKDFFLKNEAPLYRKAKDDYQVYDFKKSYEYDKKYTMMFPRMYSTQPQHIEEYKRIMNIKSDRKPTQTENIGYLIKHQIGHFWGRYFLWNFVGRAGSDYGSGALAFNDWSGKGLPSQMLKDKARNNYYMLPLFLGIMGFIFHVTRDLKNWAVVSLFFFFTGIAIILYLNQPPIEPRERDYTHVGSFYAFSIWIGLGVLFIYDMLNNLIKNSIVAPTLATLVCLGVPGIMIAEGWDDHDRSKRFHSVDSAINLLNSCAPNAILFTGGDNDTYPLWYAQEVEEIRTDVRVCNLSLLNTDWYINQMKRKSYLSAPLPITLKDESYMSGTNDMLYFVEDKRFESGISLQKYVKLVDEKNRLVTQISGGGESYSIYPSKNFIVPIDKAKILSLGIVDTSMTDYIVDKLAWNVGANSLDKKSLIILDMIANNNWERPIYFSSTLSGEDFLNLREYMQLEGLAYRLMPAKVPGAKNGWTNSTIMYNNMMKKFAFRNMADSSIFYDENYLRFPANARNQYHALAGQLIAEGKLDKAKEVLNYSLAMMPDHTIPYDYYMPSYISLLYKVGEDKKAEHIATTMSSRSIEMLEYMDKNKMSANSRDYQLSLAYLDQIVNSLKEAGKTEQASKYYEKLMFYYQKGQ